MKLKHFLALVGVVGIAGIVLLVKACDSGKKSERNEVAVTPPPMPSPTPAPPPIPAPTPAPTPASGDLPARAYDAEVLAWRDKTIGTDKMKDVSKGKPYKINIYKDAGQATANRAKVDVDRDDKWDEKYTFEPGKITLERAPGDDEQYTETYHWTGSGWRPASAATPPVAETPPGPTPAPTQVTLAARSHDADVMAWKDRTVSGKTKDVTAGKPYKVNV